MSEDITNTDLFRQSAALARLDSRRHWAREDARTDSGFSRELTDAEQWLTLGDVFAGRAKIINGRIVPDDFERPPHKRNPTKGWFIPLVDKKSEMAVDAARKRQGRSG